MLISILLAIPAVQTKLGKLATNILNEDYNTNITVHKVKLSLFGDVDLKEIEILDHHLDSMIFVKKLTTSIFSYRNILKNKFEFSDIELEGVNFLIRTHKGEDRDAFVQFIESFDEEKSDSIPSDFLLTADSVILEDFNLKIYDENKLDDVPVAFRNVTGPIENFKIDGPNFNGDIRGLSFVENHEIEVESLISDFSYTREKMSLFQTELSTENSKVTADIVFFRDGSFKDFNNKVKFKGDIKSADLSLEDLRKFYGEFGHNNVLHFKTKLEGTLNDFKTRGFQLESDLRTIIVGDFHVKNAFESENGFSIYADLNNLVSEYDNLKNLLPNILSKSVPTSFKDLGRFGISGTSFISNSEINTDIEINTDLGSIITDLHLTDINNIDNASYKGNLKIIEFDLGKIANDSLIGKISLDADIDGYGFTFENLNTVVVGEVYEHNYKGYSYNNIDVNGRFQNKKFEGELIVSDENLQLKFNGLADLSKEIYKFDFRTTVGHADFNQLNLFTRDSVAILKGDIDIDLRGNSFENVVGSINFKESSYNNEIGNYYFEDFDITSENVDSIKVVKINSTDIINGEIRGNFKFIELPNLTQNALGSIYTNYSPNKVTSGQFLDFEFDIKNKIVEVFFPEVILSKNTLISGFVNSDDADFKLNLKSPKIEAYENTVDDIRLQIDNKNPLFNTQLTIDKVSSKNYKISKLNLVNVTLNDTLFFRTEFFGGIKGDDKYDLGFYHTIDENNNSVVGLNSSEIDFRGTKWLLNPTENKQNRMIFNNQFSQFEVLDFEMVSDEQKVVFKGYSKALDNKHFNLELDNVKLEGITPDLEDWQFEGLIDGDINYTINENGVLPIANVTIENFIVNDSYQGDLDVSMRGRNSSETFNINLSLGHNDFDSLFANGVLDFAPEEPTVDVAFEFEKFKLDILSPIGDENFEDMRGHIYGNARLSGLLANPDMDGEFYLFDAGLAMPYLNVNYDFEGTTIVNLHGQTFEIIDLTLKDDVKGTRGTLLGSISHDYFTDWKLDLNLNTDNLLVLNTEQTEESLYYGQGYIDGGARIEGFTDNLTIDVNGKTNKGTRFVIPMSSSSTVDNTGIVTFTTGIQQGEEREIPDEVLFERLKGLKLNFNLQVTKDAEIEMVLDNVTGSMLKGSGTGDLQIAIDMNGMFNMYGDFIIDKGLYNFNFKDVINKEFTATRGGRISWNGNPYEADIDIETIFRVYANPKYLLENVYTSRDIAVDLVARFSGELFNSKQEYDILMPDADSEIKAELDFKLNGSNDFNTKMNNFGSLLIFGSFYSDESTLGDNSRMLIAGISEEFLSSALTNIINSNNNNVKIGVTYDIGSPTSDIQNLETDDQLGFTVATQINDRILIDGKLGVPVGSNNQSGLVGEVEIEFLLNEEGTLRSSVFNRQNEIQYSEEEEGYTQGVGLTYQFDFDTSSEFLERLGLKKTQAKKDSLAAIKKDSIPVKKSVVGFKN